MIRRLFVPGLLDVVPDPGQGQRQAFPRLETLLARADPLSEPVGYAAALFALFGIAPNGETDLPTAAVSFLADTGAPPPGFLLHADPLQLLPDRDRLLAFGLDDDPLDRAETAELIEVFDTHFANDGLRLQAAPGGRLYLHCERAPAIRTRSLSVVIGRNLDPYLPTGEERGRWAGLLNETQMLCHALGLNRGREALGRPTLGGLWFSGGGCLPPAGQSPVARVEGDCPLARGLLALRPGGDEELVVEHAPGRAAMRADPTAWQRAVVDLEGRIAGLLEGCDELSLHPGNGRVYRWNARASRRWWRRRRPLRTFLDSGTRPGRGPGGDIGL